MLRFGRVCALVLSSLLAASLVAGGCGGGTKQGATRGGLPAGAAIVPASVPAFVTIDSNLDSPGWQAVKALARKFPGESILLDSLRRELAKEGLDFSRDIEPVLGEEIDVVWLDFANGGANVVALTKSTDPAKLKKLLVDDPLFRAARESAKMPGEVLGYVYLNLEDGLPYVFDLAERSGSPVPALARENVAPLRSGLVYVSRDGKRLRLTAFVAVE
jgi:hypothetical protein